MMEEFNIFNTEYESLLHELKSDNLEVFKISINMEEEEPVNQNLSEEYSYLVLLKNMISKIDVNSVKQFQNYDPLQNEFDDEF